MVAALDPLVSPARLARLLAHTGPPPVLLDVRWRLVHPSARPDYEAAHLPGAVFVDLDTDLADPPGPAGRHPLPDPGRLQDVLRRAGVGSDSTVVAYDDGDGAAAARAWWVLRWAGVPAGRVAVLDGGYRAWVAEGLPVGPDQDTPEPGDVTVRPGGMPVLDADAAALLARDGVLLDARPGERYRGEVEPFDRRPGHIPGARNAPSGELAGPDGGWHPPEEMARRLTARMGTPDAAGEVGAYCGSGITAAGLVLAAEHARLRGPERPIALYPGSWSNWSADPARPAALGEAP